MRPQDSTDNPRDLCPGSALAGGRLLRVVALLGALTVSVVLLGPSTTIAAADLESASPAPGSTIASVPSTILLFFDEAAAEVEVHVVGPDDDEVQAGTAEVDLNDPTGRRVMLSMRANLPLGEYSVEWRATSGVDGAETTGAYRFSVTDGPASPVAVGPADGSSTLPQDYNGNPLGSQEGNYDGRSYAISVGVGMVAVVALAMFWLAVRPRDPRFGSRARG